MGTDRIEGGSDANAETVEEESERPPPPPPDKPGTDGYPSRAQSRLGAAAANDTNIRATDDVREEKLDTARPSQESSTQKEITVAEDKPKPPDASEVNEGESFNKDASISGRRHEIDHRERKTDGTAEVDQRPEESNDAGGQEQGLGGQDAPHDYTTTNETDSQPVSPSIAERAEKKDAGERSVAEISESVNVADTSSMDIGGRADSAPRETANALVPAPDTEQPPQNTPDAPDDVADDDMRRPARPAEDIAEVAPKTTEVQDRPANTDDASSNGEDTPARRIKSLDGAHLGAADEGPEEATIPTDEQHDIGGELTAKSEPSSEGVEVTQAPGGPDIAGDLPTGEELVKMESDKQSRAERARRKLYESGDEVLDDVGKVVNRLDQIFERPPTGHAETRTGPEVIPAPHEGVNAGDAATALIAAGFVVGEIFRRGREKLKQRKGV